VRVNQLLVSIDLDDAWAYLRARETPGWDDAPTVLPVAADRLREVLDTAGIAAATVFVVGRDARRPDGRSAIRRFQQDGLEIADHSLEHRGELASRSEEEIRADLHASRDAIAQVTGRVPTGFRCPSFGASPALSAALRGLGYHYDASPLPTTLLPLLRLYHRVSAGRGEHAPTYGNLRTAFGPLRPTFRDGLARVPTTTMPVVRLPFHASYLSALAGRSLPLALTYARVADRLCRLRGLPVSFLLHPTDVLDRGDAPHLAFFPGMSVPWHRKKALMVAVLRRLAEDREVVTIADAAAGVRIPAISDA
jgi:peptidoglycan/xylan/chitin deacetylase (PgdA/CDA1 family)